MDQAAYYCTAENLAVVVIATNVSKYVCVCVCVHIHTRCLTVVS